MKKPILCLDFDGVIHSYTSGWQGADVVNDPPVPGAIEFIFDALKEFEVHIFSSRSDQEGGIDAMMNWILYHMTRSDRVNPTARFLELKWPKHKPPAMVTIDDRAITFTGEWPKIRELLDFKPWNKKGVG